MRRDQERPLAARERPLEPLDRREVEVVRRLVEEQQVGVRDRAVGRARRGSARRRTARGAGTTSALRARRARPGPRRRAGPGDSRRAPRTARGASRRRPMRPPRRPAPSSLASSVSIASTSAAPLRTTCPDGGRLGPALVELRLLVEPGHDRVACDVDATRVGRVESRDDPQQRALARAVRADQPDSLAARQARADRVEDDERADLAADPVEAEDGHRPSVLYRRRGYRCGRVGGAQASGSGPPSSLQRRPRRGATVLARRRREPRVRAGPLGRRQALAPRAEVRAALPEHEPPDRSPAAPARQPGALVDVEVLLHLAVALGRGVVVDRGPATLHGLPQHGPDGLVEVALVGRSQRRDRTQRMQLRAPQGLVGVDVADPRDEALVGDRRLEPAAALAQSLTERAQREGLVERLGPEVLEQLADVVRTDDRPLFLLAVETEAPELADVPIEEPARPVGATAASDRAGVEVETTWTWRSCGVSAGSTKSCPVIFTWIGEDVTARQGDDEPLGAAPDAQHARPDQACPELLGRRDGGSPCPSPTRRR